MLWVLLIVPGFILTAVIIGISLSAQRYTGPETDHFDGKRFKNLSGAKAHGLGSVFKWAINRKRGSWVPLKETAYGEKPPTETHSIRITFINHSSFLIQVDGVNLLTDPVYSQRTSPFQFAGPKRQRPPGIRFEDLPPIHYVLISHNHYDHLDVATVKKLKEVHDPKFVTPLGVAQFLRKLGITASSDLDWWNKYSINKDMEIQSVPAQHFSGRGVLDRDATLWCGYVIHRANGNIYFAGDSGYDKKMFKAIGDQAGPIKVAMIPIGAYVPRWFMSPIHISPDEAVRVHEDVRSAVSIGMHYGTFPLADDGQSQPVEDLEKVLESRGISKDKFLIIDEGKGRQFE